MPTVPSSASISAATATSSGCSRQVDQVAISADGKYVVALQAIQLLAASATIFGEKCIAGLEATGRGPELLQSGLMLATALAPAVGYEQAAKIAKAAHTSGRTVLEEALELTDLPEEELRELLDPAQMVAPAG